jgi:VCBS repeat-containing protein
MGYANYIGRVGALAVALGVGVAVATGHGLGLASADETAPPSPDTSSDGSPSDPPSNTPSPDPTNDPTTPPTTLTASSGSASGSTHSPTPPEMIYDNTGGAHTSGEDEKTNEPSAEQTPPPPPAAPTITPGPTSSAPTTAAPPPSPTTTENAAPQEVSTTTTSTATNLPAPVDNISQIAVPIATPTADDPLDTTISATGVGGHAQSRLMSTFSIDDPVDTADQQLFMATTATQQESDLATTEAAPAPLLPQPSGPVDVLLGLPGVVVNMATTVVSMLLAPFLTPGPVNPAQPPVVLFAVLDWVRREIQRTFFNRTPDGGVDNVTTSEDMSKTIPVLANDTDADGDVKTVTGLSQPLHGTAVLNPDGTITYTPNTNFSGTDTFTYTVSDASSPWHVHGLFGFLTGGGHTDTVTVNVSVTGVNDPPVAVDDTNTTSEDNAVSGNVLSNDTDVDTPASGLSAALGTGPVHGSAVVNQNGTYTYTSAANFHGTDEFTYTVFDGALSDTGKVTITVSPVNDPPTAVNDGVTVAEDSIANPINVLANDTDPDAGDTKTVDEVTQGANGTVLNNGNSVLYTPNPNFNGTDSFTYTISDAAGATSTATVHVTITGVADTPVANPDAYTTAEDTAVIVNALANDIDPDGNPLDRKLVTDPSHGTLAEINDGPNAGAWTYTPNPNFYGTDTFTYHAYDGTEFSNTVTVTITVTPVNDAPVANPDTYTTAEDTALTVSIPNGVTGNDSDVDDNAALIATVVDTPDHGTLTFNPNGTFTYTPNANYHGTDTFTYHVSDGELDSNTTTVTITITAYVSPITANDDAYTAIADTFTGLTPALTANDTTDLGSPLGAVTIVTDPTYGILFEDNGVLNYRPRNGFTGTDTFAYTVADSANPNVVSNTATVTVTVISPLMANDDASTVLMDTSTDLTPALTANDTTAPGVPNIPLGAVTIVDGPTHGMLTQTGDTGPTGR